MTRTAVAVLLVLLAGAPAWAQTDFTRLKLEPGDQARIIRRSGIQVAGVVTAIGPDHITIGDLTLEPEPGLKIDRPGDSVLTGGTLVGVGLGAFFGSAIPDCGGERVACLMSGVIAYGGLGALIDYLHVGRTTVFRGRTPRRGATVVAPVVSPDRKGIVVSIGF
jgi:hypothetical protein